MNWAQAQKALEKGQSVYRVRWRASDYVKRIAGVDTEYTNKTQKAAYKPTREDMAATDWMTRD